jgi:hypothetical protein
MMNKIKTRVMVALLGKRYITIQLNKEDFTKALLKSHGLNPIQELSLLEDTWVSLRNHPDTIQYARELGKALIDEEFERMAADYDGLGNEVK